MPPRQRSWTLLSTQSAPSTPSHRRPWWKRALSGCITSSNPEEEDESDTAPSSSALVTLGKKPRKAAYVPQYAKSSFAKSATPIKQRDPDRAKKVSGLYRSTSTTEHVEGGGLRSRVLGKKAQRSQRSMPRPSSEGLLRAR